MQFKQDKNSFFVFIEKNEKVIETLTQFCNHHKIFTGEITGIGAVKEIELGAYDPIEKKYNTISYPDTYELISLNGNITLKEDEPFIHAHMTMGDHDMNILGGHLFEMKVAVVGEFIIHRSNTTIKRTMNEEIGLATWNINKEE